MTVEKRNGLLNTVITTIMALIAGITFCYQVLVRPVETKVLALESCMTQDKRDLEAWKDNDAELKRLISERLAGIEATLKARTEQSR